MYPQGWLIVLLFCVSIPTVWSKSRMGESIDCSKAERATPAYRRFRWSIRSFSICMHACTCACAYLCASCIKLLSLLEIARDQSETIDSLILFISDCGWKKMIHINHILHKSRSIKANFYPWYATIVFRIHQRAKKPWFETGEQSSIIFSHQHVEWYTI